MSRTVGAESPVTDQRESHSSGASPSNPDDKMIRESLPWVEMTRRLRYAPKGTGRRWRAKGVMSMVWIMPGLEDGSDWETSAVSVQMGNLQESCDG